MFLAIVGSSILSAVEKCAEEGFNVVSMSLGGPLPNIFEYFSYRGLLEDGVLTIAAAGNSGNTMVRICARIFSLASTGN